MGDVCSLSPFLFVRSSEREAYGITGVRKFCSAPPWVCMHGSRLLGIIGNTKM